MNREYWAMYHAARAGPGKEAILAALVREEEPLVQKFVAKFAANTRYYIDPIREDLLQAARIGIIKAINKWDPARGAFSTLAGYECRFEIQNILRHILPITRPRDRDINPQNVQDRAAIFYAKHGRDPEPGEIGVKDNKARLAEQAAMSFAHIDPGDLPAEDLGDIEERIDRSRDSRALTRFLGRLSETDKRDLLAGKRPDIEAKAKKYIERRRAAPRKKAKR